METLIFGLHYLLKEPQDQIKGQSQTSITFLVMPSVKFAPIINEPQKLLPALSQLLKS